MRRVLIPADLPPALRLPRADAAVHRLGGPTMGTSWSVQYAEIVPHETQVVRAAVERVLAGVIAQMSTWIEDSEIGRFNRAPAGTWCELSADFDRVLRYALSVARDTGGCYDPTIGALVDLWGFGRPGPRKDVPSDRLVEAAAARGGFRRLTFGPGPSVLQPGGMQLDLSSVAKGFAVDRVSDALLALGIVHHLVEIGGELKGSGTKPDGSPWWVALEEPAADARETVVALHGLSVATSGDAQRHFEADGCRFSHTIDPRDGRPVPDRLACVTVLHPICMRADALATALTVLGPDGGIDYATVTGIAARFVIRRARGHEERITPAFAAMLE